MTGEQAQYLLETHGDMVWRLCRRLAGPECEDLFQDTFLRTMTAQVEGIEQDSARNLLYTICLNAYRSQFAKRKRRSRHMAEMPEDFEASDGETDTAIDAQRKLAAKAAREAVGRLPDKYRIPVEMHYFAGWTSAQIAQSLNMKEGTVRANLHRARKKLGKELEEWL